MDRPRYYIYLLSSLPMLQFETGAPFSFEAFLNKCRDSISDEDFFILSNMPEVTQTKECQKIKIIQKWLEFETMLRNELVKLRAIRKHIEPDIYLRTGDFFDANISHVALNAYKSTSILDAEKILDMARWHKLDELEQGHFFDFESLVVYALRMLILLRWDKIKTADSVRALEVALLETE